MTEKPSDPAPLPPTGEEIPAELRTYWDIMALVGEYKARLASGDLAAAKQRLEEGIDIVTSALAVFEQYTEAAEALKLHLQMELTLVLGIEARRRALSN